MKWQKYFRFDDNSRRGYYLTYTVIFFVMAFFCYLPFWTNGKTMIWQTDGLPQHYTALVYYAQWMREIVHHFLQTHTLEISTFSFDFGLGADLFTTLQYYVIGDPFTYLAIFVPSDYMEGFYSFLILLRMYCVGISFSMFERYRKKEKAATLAGAFVYTFSTYAVYASVRHPFFLNPMIFFPILLLGVEKLRREKKTGMLIAGVAVSASSNFYFFYMLVIMVVCYVLLDICVNWKKQSIKNTVAELLRITAASVTGVLISAVFLLPVVLMFLQDSRAESQYVFRLFYPISYYGKFLSTLISNGLLENWGRVGSSAVTLLAVFLLFREKEKSRLKLKIAVVISIVSMLIPFMGYLLNGFSNVSNRWSWGLVMIFACTLTEMWPNLKNANKREILYLILCSIVYFLLCLLTGGMIKSNYLSFYAVLIGALGVLILGNEIRGQKVLQKENGSQIEGLLLFVVLIGSYCIAHYTYSESGKNYLSEFVPKESLEKCLQDNEGIALRERNDETPFYRYSQSNYKRKSKNASVRHGYPNTQYYWSLSNGKITNFYNDTLTRMQRVYSLNGLDSRTALEELVSSKYFVTEEKNSVGIPYGYEYVSSSKYGNDSTYYVYENKYELPLGYTYDSYLLEEDAKNLTPLERQEAMLQTVIVEEEEKNFPKNEELSFSQQTKDYKVTCNSKDVSQQGKSFVVTKENASVTLSVEGIPNRETYLYIKNLQFQGASEYSLYGEEDKFDPLNLYTEETWKKLSEQEQKDCWEKNLVYVEPCNLELEVKTSYADEKKAENKIFLETPYYKYYNNRTDQLVNLFYAEEPVTKITITFPEIGIYSFDEINVLFQSMEHYEQQIKERKEDVLENVDLHKNTVNATNHISGELKLEKQKMLVLSIPYSKGWTAYVDGEKAEIKTVNSMFMGIEVAAGEHQIELRYQTPGLKEGFFISAFGLLLVVGYTVVIHANYVASKRIIFRKKGTGENEKN